MKQKIKIMKHKQQPTDQEIQSYMNFDRLLDSRKIALNTMRNAAMLKWGVSALALSAVVGTVILFNTLNSDEQGSSKKYTDTIHMERVLPTVPVDTITDQHQLQSSASEKESGVSSAPRKIESAPVKKSKPKEKETAESGYVQAEPINGYPDLYNYFNTHLVYPTEGLKDSIQGVQTISFIVNKDGKAEQIEVVKSLGEPFEKESKRLIETMPDWKPATLDGKPVASRVSLPLTFQIQKIKK
jgi:TonB family protein